MKTIFMSALLLLPLGVAVWSQGTVNFANGAAGVNAPVMTASDNTSVEGPDWQAELWMQDTNANWIRVSQPVPFLTQPVAGYFLGGSAVKLAMALGRSGCTSKADDEVRRLLISRVA